MKNELVKKALPHFIAILIFLITAALFCKPALEGNVLDQHDIVGWKGMAQNAFDYKEKHGHFPLWNPALFSGMPNYLIAMEGKSILPNLTAIFSLGLPQPVNMFFLAALCFYLLCICWGTRPVVGIFGGLAYAFATYNPIIIAAGHVTKMFAIAYMPLMLAGMLLVFRKKYYAGLALSTLGAYLLLNANHPQITYYFLIVALFVTLGYAFTWIREKDFRHMGIAAGILVIAAGAGALTTSLSLLTTSEYSQFTMRGGKSVEIQGDSVKTVKTEGLDTSYAFSYSLGPGEGLTMLMPGAFGDNNRSTFAENEKIIAALESRGVPSANANQLAGQLPRFWGDPNSSGGGPFYAGVLVCLLALLGFVLYRAPLRWALLVVAVLALVMAMGKYMLSFNLFLFENLPLYNKFRAPSITMVIPQLLLPFVAIIALHLLFIQPNARELTKANFKKILYAMGGLILVLGILYLMMDYSALTDPGIRSGLLQMGASEDMTTGIISAMKSERQSMFGGQVLRTLGFAVLLLLVIWFWISGFINSILAVSLLAVITLIDQAVVANDYLNAEKYVPAEDLEAQLTRKNAVDQQILADQEPHFRVYNAGPEKFSASDYHYPTFHRTAGGYHPAKLRIYQDILERYLYYDNGTAPSNVLNMLNVKYSIIPTGANGQASLMQNPGAMGPVWLVKNLFTVPDAAAELQAIDQVNLRDTAVLQESFAAGIAQPQWDSAASIRLTHFNNDTLRYAFEATSPQFAVFSDIYYPKGWNAYVDGQPANYIKVNYALRGMSLPAGRHEIAFIFEPASVKKGITLSYIGSWLVLLLTLGGFFMAWRQGRTKPEAKK